MRPMVQAGLVGAAVVLLVELVALGQARPSFVLAVASLMLALGLVCGLVMALAELAVARLQLAALPAALVRAAGAIPVFVFLSWELFTGGRARTLPGAEWARVWVPILGFGALAATIWLAQRLTRRRAVRGLLLVPLCALVIVSEIGNRYLFRSEYPDIHAFLVVVSVVGAAVAWYVLTSAAPGQPPASSRVAQRRARLVTTIAAIAVVIGFIWTLGWGLAAKRDRWVVATQGVHTRQLTRVLRKVLDFDGDGYSRFLGGGDCDDGNAAVSPAAHDLPGNRIDEDCDGEDEPLPPPPPEPQTPMTYGDTLAAWLSEPETESFTAQTREYHILFVVLDAVRADMLEPTEENRHEFPRLFELAGESRVFRHAFSPAAGTDVCVTSLLTGRYNPFVPIETTMTEALSATGRLVHAVVPGEVLRWAGRTMISRGLDTLDELVTDRARRDVGSHSSSAETTDLGLAFLDHRAETASRRPFFLWLHYFDVHEHLQMKTGDKRLRELLDAGSSPTNARKYRAIVQIIDRELGRMIDEVKRRDLWGQTIVVALADHGESLGEDPRLPDAHGRFLYNPLVHVPLIIRVPGVSPTTIEQPVSLVDLMPTVLQLAGAQVPEGVDGNTLLPHLVDDAPVALTEQDHPIVLHESEQHGLIVWPYKLLVRPAENLVELYDLERDFAEKNDLSDADPGRVRELTKLYKSLPHLQVVRTREALKAREKLARPPGASGPAD